MLLGPCGGLSAATWRRYLADNTAAQRTGLTCPRFGG
jgi:hypothetical protein